MEGSEGALKFMSTSLDAQLYVPGRFVAVSVDNINKPMQTQGHGFKTAVRNGLVPLKVVYPNERYSPDMTVWVEAGATKLPWAGGDYQFTIGDGPRFALLPEDYVRLVTR
jgi:hypothetical protein